MKQNKQYLSIFISGLFLLIPFALLWAESNIQNITLQREGDYTKVTILADAPFQINHFIQEKQDGKPYRIVLDCLNAVHSLSQSNFFELPPGIITSIRTSQYQTAPEKICRVVLDLKNPIIYKVLGGTEKNGVALALSTPQEPAYPIWSVAQVKSAPKSPEVEKSKKEEPTISTHNEKEIKLSQKSEPASIQKVQPAEKPVPHVKKEEQKPSPPVEQTKESGSKIIQEGAVDTMKTKPLAPAPGQIAGEIPQRKILVYHSGKRKDPFAPYNEKKNFEIGTLPLPRVEELKLVGILEDNNGFKALLENDMGYGYILQPGDRIRNGSVVSIDKERVIFQIQEYGFTKNIALELFTPNKEER